MLQEEMKVSSLVELAQTLVEHDNFLIVSHEHPDADSIGSMLGLFHTLSFLGKKCQLICDDPVPDYGWPGMECFRTMEEIQPFETAIVLDCEPSRTGKFVSILADASFLINIDHHQGNNAECSYQFVDPKQAATAMIVYKLVKLLGVPFSPEIAKSLYGGILGDTGGFRYSNTTYDVFLAAAELVTHGALPADTARELFECKSFEFLKILGFALSKIQLSTNKKIAWMALTCQDFHDFSVDPSDCDQLIQYARMVAGTEIAILFREVAPQEIRIGFRSHRVSIHTLASHFGGGGHLLAAGAKVEGMALPAVIEAVLAQAHQVLE